MLRADGSATVQSAQHGDASYTVTAGVCPCKDYAKAPHQLCKHRFGAAITRRALDLTRTPGDDAQRPPAPGPDQDDHPPTLPPELLPCIVYLHGTPFVQYSGLLTLAHAPGLVALKATLDLVTPELALASAVAAFQDGRRFREVVDATPANVGATVRPHYPRIALTHSKARVLRDALGITAVALEELRDDA